MKYIFNVIFIFLYFTRKSVIARATNSKHAAPEYSSRTDTSLVQFVKSVRQIVH